MLFHLFQLTSPALPVGAFSYSEGLETLIQAGKIADAPGLEHWLIQELCYGAIRIEAAVMVRTYRYIEAYDTSGLGYWNQWLSAFRETEELRQQSWQMGRALVRLLRELEPSLQDQIDACGEECNFAIAFCIAAVHWNIDLKSTLSGYLHSWATNLISAGMKLIPLGQTQGQRLLINLYPHLQQVIDAVLIMTDDDMYTCGWGLAIASMGHETLYSRLFRS
jgi:urease accessory protein